MSQTTANEFVAALMRIEAAARAYLRSSDAAMADAGLAVVGFLNIANGAPIEVDLGLATRWDGHATAARNDAKALAEALNAFGEFIAKAKAAKEAP